MKHVEKKCANCGKAFVPSKPQVKYCSHACYSEAKKTYSAEDLERFKTLITDGLTAAEAANLVGKSSGVLTHALLKSDGLTISQLRAKVLRLRTSSIDEQPGEVDHKMSILHQKLNLPKSGRKPGRPRKTHMKKCPICGQSFVTKNVRQIYCSLRCTAMSPRKAKGKARRTLRTLRKTCEECGKEYETKRAEQRYCSNACSQKNLSKNMRRLQEKICPNCLKSFRPYCSRIKFCSKKCYREGVKRGGMVRGEFRYADGVYIRYESSYELAFLLYAKAHPSEYLDVKRSNFTIPYTLDGQQHDFWPDFVALNKGGQQLLIELKSAETERKDPRRVEAKFDAGSRWCEDHGYEFMYLTNADPKFVGMCNYVRDHLGPDMLKEIKKEDKGRRVTKYCLECGKAIPRGQHGVAKYLQRKFCSQECFKKSPLSKKKRLPSSHHVCAQCGREFYGGRTKKYCSKRCYTAAQTKRKLIRCAVCDKEFWGGKGRKYCSQECYAKSPRASSPLTQRKRVCAVCGKQFTSKHGRQETCSRGCGAILAARTRKQTYQPKTKPVIICQQCGNEFQGQEKRKYCSPDCFHKARTALKVIECPVCGREFKPRFARVKTCSKQCGQRLRRQTKEEPPPDRM